MVGTIIGWIIGLIIVAFIGMFFSRIYFVSSAVSVIAAVYLMIISFKDYDQIFLSEFWAIEIQRFVCLYVIFAFNFYEFFSIRNGDGKEVTVYLDPNFLKNAALGVVTSAGLLAFFDGLLPQFGVRSFAFIGFLALIVALPNIYYIIRDIRGVGGYD